MSRQSGTRYQFYNDASMSPAVLDCGGTDLLEEVHDIPVRVLVDVRARFGNGLSI